MNETWVTLQGWVGGEVARRDAGEVPVATFRVACTPRFQRDGLWVDGPTSWHTVHAWRGLADHVAESVHKGDPVVVHGRLRAEVWEREGQPDQVTSVVDAVTVGHDLSKGTGRFTRTPRRDRSDQAGAQQAPQPDESEEVTASGAAAAA